MAPLYLCVFCILMSQSLSILMLNPGIYTMTFGVQYCMNTGIEEHNQNTRLILALCEAKISLGPNNTRTKFV
jgi:hypothetical protein